MSICLQGRCKLGQELKIDVSLLLCLHQFHVQLFLAGIVERWRDCTVVGGDRWGRERDGGSRDEEEIMGCVLPVGSISRLRRDFVGHYKTKLVKLKSHQRKKSGQNFVRIDRNIIVDFGLSGLVLNVTMVMCHACMLRKIGSGELLFRYTRWYPARCCGFF
jgi:hypothetical protein